MIQIRERWEGSVRWIERRTAKKKSLITEDQAQRHAQLNENIIKDQKTLEAQ